MHPLCRAVALGACLLSSAFGQTAARELGTISGHLYCADTQTPCRFATVNVQSAPPIAKNPGTGQVDVLVRSYSTSTGLDGRFEIRGVEAGEYYILGRLAGYLSPYDLAASESGAGHSVPTQWLDKALGRITVDAGQSVTVDLTLRRGASIEGTVLYDDGGFGVNIPIHLFRRDFNGKWASYNAGVTDPDLAPLGVGTHTDDRGRFYEAGLPPGFYVVEATFPDSIVIPEKIVGAGSVNVNITTGGALRVFSGDKYRLREAEIIELKEGEARSDLTIDLPAHGLHVIRGAVVSKSGNRGISGGTVSLLDPADSTVLRETQIKEDGTFSFDSLTAGLYLVRIVSDGHDGGLRGGYESVTGQLLIENDMFNITYTLSPKKN